VLPCGVSAKVAFRKSKYESTSKTIKPSPKGLTVKVKLERPSVQVMVSAKGAGLKAGSVTVLVNGKAVGTAPRKVPIPAWTTSKITFRADGYKDVTKSVTTQGEDAAPGQRHAHQVAACARYIARMPTWNGWCGLVVMGAAIGACGPIGAGRPRGTAVGRAGPPRAPARPSRGRGARPPASTAARPWRCG
jgi:hypothetical protein